MTHTRHTGATAPFIAAACTAIAAAFLLAGYEFVRSASGTLFQEAYGKDAMVYLMAGMPLGVLTILFIYGKILTHAGPRATLLITTLGSALALTLATAALAAGFRPASIALYIFREAYVVLIIEQYWSLLNSTLGDDRARKLNGPICGVASLGAIAGGVCATLFLRYNLNLGFATLSLTTATLPYLAAALALPAALFSDLAYRATGEPDDTPPRLEPHRPALALREFIRTPMLARLLGIILATQILSATLELQFWGLLKAHFADADQRTAYSAGVFVWINIIAGVMQFIVTPIVLRLIPPRAIHIIIPLTNAAACAAMLAYGGLTSTVIAYTLFKCIDYSVFRAAKELLYIPLAFDARYRAKEVIDVLGYRFGKGGASTFYSVMQITKIAAAPFFGWVCIAAAIAWSILALRLTPRTQARG